MYFRSTSEGKVLADEEQRLVLLNELAKETDDRKLIRSQVLNILQAAEDGAAIVISNTLLLLSRHPKVLDSLKRSCIYQRTRPNFRHAQKHEVP